MTYLMEKKITFIDLFAGIGGIRQGFEKNGFECVFSSEINEECKKTYEANYGEIPFGDISKIDAKDIPDHDVLCAGFPCQPFSISGKQKGFSDTRGTLFFEICRIVKQKKPKVIFLENVKHLKNHDHGNTLATIISEIERLEYTVEWKILNASDFGVAQNRERIIIVASQKKPFKFDKVKTRKKVVLNDILDKDENFEYLNPSEYTIIDSPKVQASGLIFAGYRNKAIRKAGVRPGTENLSRVHKQPNRIYSVKGVHPTLPSQEVSGRYYIYTLDNKVRKLTLNECYKLMGYSNEFKKVCSVAEQYKQIGNSVCVPMIYELAKEIKNQFFGGATNE